MLTQIIEYTWCLPVVPRSSKTHKTKYHLRIMLCAVCLRNIPPNNHDVMFWVSFLWSLLIGCYLPHTNGMWVETAIKQLCPTTKVTLSLLDQLRRLVLCISSFVLSVLQSSPMQFLFCFMLLPLFSTDTRSCARFCWLFSSRHRESAMTIKKETTI